MKKYRFYGEATVTINLIEVEAESIEVARELAKNVASQSLTLYGKVDTQVDNPHRNVIVELKSTHEI